MQAIRRILWDIFYNLAVLPLVGTIDTFRTQRIQEITLEKISLNKTEKLIIDLSGVIYMDTAVVSHLFKIVDGIEMMGCKAVITGIRSEIANTMINLGVSFAGKVETRGTLEKALEQVFVSKSTASI
jgi:anti-anti-sigma factor